MRLLHAAVEGVTKATKSVFLAVGMQAGVVDGEVVAKAALLEANLQAEKWGTLEDAHTLTNAGLHRQLYLCKLLM